MENKRFKASEISFHNSSLFDKLKKLRDAKFFEDTTVSPKGYGSFIPPNKSKTEEALENLENIANLLNENSSRSEFVRFINYLCVIIDLHAQWKRFSKSSNTEVPILGTAAFIDILGRIIGYAEYISEHSGRAGFIEIQNISKYALFFLRTQRLQSCSEKGLRTPEFLKVEPLVSDILKTRNLQAYISGLGLPIVVFQNLVDEIKKML